jgi:hypothetical protein
MGGPEPIWKEVREGFGGLAAFGSQGFSTGWWSNAEIGWFCRSRNGGRGKSSDPRIYKALILESTKQWTTNLRSHAIYEAMD